MGYLPANTSANSGGPVNKHPVCTTWAKSRARDECVWFLVSDVLSSASMKSATIVLWELSGFLEREETAAICGLATSLTSFCVLFGSSDLVLELVSKVLTKVFEALRPTGGLQVMKGKQTNQTMKMKSTQ